MDSQIKVILYYKYVKIDAEKVLEEQREICEKNNLKGRILLANEGINGTLSGTEAEVQNYIDYMQNDSRFSDIDFKMSDSDIHPFPKLKIKVRKEIVTLGLKEDIDMEFAETGKYLEPDEVHQLIESGEEVYFVDARNLYETKIGTFKNALIPEIENFREFPEYLEKIADLKNKKVVFFCTGGVRCEKATAYALKKGFKDVYHIHGGIQRYAEKYPKGGYEGAMYVFDNRITMRFDNSEDRTILTTCEYCAKPCDEYKNCFNAKCNKRMIVCDECFKTNEGCCSKECVQIKYPRKVAYRFQELLDSK